MAGAGYTMENPWAPAPESLWRNNDLSPQRQALRASVAQQDAKEFKLQDAILRGRLYGLGAAHYRAIRQRKLEAVLKRQVITSEHW